MSGCNFQSRLDAFCDGEMNATEHAAFQQHLNGCADCSATVARTERMSQLFAGMRGQAAEKVEADEIARLHAAVDREMNRSVFQVDRSFWRTAGLISGLAASVLIVASTWLTETQPVQRLPGSVAVAPAGEKDFELDQLALGGPVYPLPSAGTEVNPNQPALADAHDNVTDWMLENLKGAAGR
jgi:anti-sigma factor RsiW